DPPGREPGPSPRRPRTQTLLLPANDPVPRRTHRRSPPVRLSSSRAAEAGELSHGPNAVRLVMENRSALLLVGAFLVVAGVLLTPLLCGVGFLFIILGAVMWVRED